MKLICNVTKNTSNFDKIFTDRKLLALELDHILGNLYDLIEEKYTWVNSEEELTYKVVTIITDNRQILCGMKKSNCIGIILLLVISCTEKREIAEEKQKQRRSDFIEIYSKDELIGDWVFFYGEFVKGNKSDRNPVISKNVFMKDDSLIVSLKADGKLNINGIESGIWDLNNDSLLLEGDREFRGFPLFLDTKYEVHKGRFSKNWYFYCTFYSSNRKIHHTVKYRARKRGGIRQVKALHSNFA